MIRTQVSLDERAYEAAKKEARRLGISVAELIRRALGRMLAASEPRAGHAGDLRPWMRFSGIVDSGDPGSSLTVDEVVYGREKPSEL